MVIIGYYSLFIILIQNTNFYNKILRQNKVASSYLTLIIMVTKADLYLFRLLDF